MAAGGTVGDRRPHLRLAVGGAGVEPVEALAALDVAAQVVEVGDRVGDPASRWSSPSRQSASGM